MNMIFLIREIIMYVLAQDFKIIIKNILRICTSIKFIFMNIND
jgi:hypothetical protein